MAAFEFDPVKEAENQQKHGLFRDRCHKAQMAHCNSHVLPKLGSVTALILVLTGCHSAADDRAHAVEELAIRCKMSFSKIDIARIANIRKTFRAIDEKRIFLGVYPGPKPYHGECIKSFTSKLGYKFFYNINSLTL